MTTTMTMRVLLCDSEPLIHDMFHAYLHPLGVKVTNVRNETQCLERLEKEEHDVIVMDTHLPGGGCVQTMKRLREKGVSTPVLLLSSHYGVTSQEDAADLGASGFIEKPFKLKEILTHLLQLVPQ